MEVTFRLPDPTYDQYTWLYEGEHNPASHPPLTLTVPGMEGMRGADGLPAGVKVNGYSFWRPDAGAPFHEPAGGSGDPALSPLERWRTFWLPRLERHLHELTAFQPQAVPRGGWRATLDALDKESGAVMGGVHLTCVFSVHRAVAKFTAAYAEHFGAGGEQDGLALLHGFDNATMRRAGDLWALSRVARQSAPLREALAAWQPGQPFPAIEGFDSALTAFLARWGQTLDRFVQDMPSWVETPAPVVQAILTQAGMPDDESPGARCRAGASRRERLEGELREAAASSPTAARALELLPAAQQYLVVLEDHNVLCDQQLAAASRARWLAIGRHLLASGALSELGDVFFFDYQELVATLEGGPPPTPAALARRKELQAGYRATVPPRFLGAPPAAPPPGTTSATPEVRGQPASPGLHRGRARVVDSLDEAATLQPGEVLVCTITSPPWTPLFAIAGALVTDAGGMLSHPSVVAREFGIPAVVGCRDATERIPDGATVEVDGTAGVVRIIAG